MNDPGMNNRIRLYNKIVSYKRIKAYLITSEVSLDLLSDPGGHHHVHLPHTEPSPDVGASPHCTEPLLLPDCILTPLSSLESVKRRHLRITIDNARKATIVSRVLGLSSGPDFLLCPTMNPGRRAGVVRIMSTVQVYTGTCTENEI